MLSPMSPSESPNLGVVLGTPHTLIIRFEVMLGDFGEGVRKQDFALDYMISGSGGNSGIGYHNKSHLGGKTTRKRPKL